MKYERMWERLIEHLNEWASAKEVSGGIRLTFEDPAQEVRTVEVVITPADWDSYLSVIFGDDDPAVADIRQAVMAMAAERQYLVYDAYDWWPSTTREPPSDPFENTTPASGGEWVVLDSKSHVTSRFSDWQDSE